MASHSNFWPEGGQETSQDRQSLKLSECICPICRCILIEPVTTPCNHELCMSCFQKNVQEASLNCPLCRKRISTWARRATKLNKLIDTERWAAIKQAFPQRVQNRMIGLEEDEDSEEDDGYIYIPNIAAPGEIRGEYEKAMQKLEAERHLFHLEEEEASKALIRQLQEEEAARRREQEELMQQDEELVRRLVADASPGSLRLTPKSTMLDRFISRSKSSSSTDSSISPLMHPARPSTVSSSSDISNPRASRVSASSSNLMQTPCRDSTGKSSSVVLLEDSNLLADLKVSPGVSSSCSASANPSELSFGDEDKMIVLDPQPQRPGSADSMSQELCHFKPIHCSPRTPARHVVGGKFENPVIIRSTPRNLSRMTSTEDENESGPSIPISSPVMRRRLNELEEERKEKVAAMSKSTVTDLPPLPVMKEDSNSCSSFLPGSSRPEIAGNLKPESSPECAVRNLSFDICSSDGGFGTAGNSTTAKNMIIPLDPHIEDSESPDATEPRPFKFYEEESRSPHAHVDSTSTESKIDMWLRAKRKKGEEKYVKSSAKKSASTSDAKVTTTLLTPNTLSDRQRKVLNGTYVDETPLRIQKKRTKDSNSDCNGKSSQSSSRSTNTALYEETFKRSPTEHNNNKKDKLHTESPVCKGSSSEAIGTSSSSNTCHIFKVNEVAARRNDINPKQEVASSQRKKPTLKHISGEKEEKFETGDLSQTQGVTSSESQKEEKQKTMTSPTSPTQKIIGSVRRRWEIMTAPLRSQSASGDTVESLNRSGAELRKSSSVSDLQKAVDNNFDKGHILKEKLPSPIRLEGDKMCQENIKATGIECCNDRGDGATDVNPQAPEKFKTTPIKKRSPQKQLTPTRRSERQRASMKRDIRENNRIESTTTKVENGKSSEVTEGTGKPIMKRMRSTEDKENEESCDSVSEQLPKRLRTNSNDQDDYSEEEVFHTPKKSKSAPHFSVEYSPEEDGKKLIKFPKSRLTSKGKKQAKLCFVNSPDAGTSGVQNKLTFTVSSGSSKGKQSGKPSSTRRSPRKYPRQKTEVESSEEEPEESQAAPVPNVLDRSHFDTDVEYRQHVEEQDMLLAQQLQADFNLEEKLRLTAIRRKGSDGQYELRKRSQSKSSVSKSSKKRTK